MPHTNIADEALSFWEDVVSALSHLESIGFNEVCCEVALEHGMVTARPIVSDELESAKPLAVEVFNSFKVEAGWVAQLTEPRRSRQHQKLFQRIMRVLLDGASRLEVAQRITELVEVNDFAFTACDMSTVASRQFRDFLLGNSDVAPRPYTDPLELLRQCRQAAGLHPGQGIKVSDNEVVVELYGAGVTDELVDRLILGNAACFKNLAKIELKLISTRLTAALLESLESRFSNLILRVSS